MGCGPNICGKSTYSYARQEKLLQSIMSEFSQLGKCYTHDFVMKCHKNLLLNTDAFLLKYQKKIQQKQNVPYIILQKWKLIIYGTNIENEHYIDCIGFDKQVEQERIASKTYRFSKRNPYQIRLQDLYFHESYKQIQKDAGRVYLVPQIKQDLFQKVLKKIANHFPESGYSLGINYLIGYFLLVGMSEIDSFWMFIHLALNEKFLALGFFQNDLPLTKVIIQIFKNILRRRNKQLYEHIYKHLEVDQNLWILKWITSFYLSTFPIQFCHYILDYVFMFGIVGLSVVAYVIVQFFQTPIFKCQDSADFSQMLKEMFSFQKFSKDISVEKFMSAIYEVNLNQKDFQYLSEVGDSFYVKYFTLYPQWKFKKNSQIRDKKNELLSDWYKYTLSKRQSFALMAKSSDGKFFESNEIEQNEDNSQDDKTKEQKVQQKTLENIEINNINIEPQNQKQKQELQVSFIDKPHTVKVSSRHRKDSPLDDKFQEQRHSFQESQSFKEGLKIIKRQLSQNLFAKQRNKQKRKIKSDGKMHSKKQSSCIQSVNELFSIKTLKNERNKDEIEIVFNQKPLSKQFSQKLNLCKTLPLRKNQHKQNSLSFFGNLDKQSDRQAKLSQSKVQSLHLSQKQVKMPESEEHNGNNQQLQQNQKEQILQLQSKKQLQENKQIKFEKDKQIEEKAQMKKEQSGINHNQIQEMNLERLFASTNEYNLI